MLTAGQRPKAAPQLLLWQPGLTNNCLPKKSSPGVGWLVAAKNSDAESLPQLGGWQPTPVFLPGESHGQRSLAGYSPQGCKESDTTERLTLHCY